MSVIELQIPDKLAKKLKPYQDQLIELLELGLQKWQEREQQERQTEQEREQQEHQTEQERLFQILAASGKVTLPKPYTGDKPYVSRTPVPATGKPASEIVIEQRGPL